MGVLGFVVDFGASALWTRFGKGPSWTKGMVGGAIGGAAGTVIEAALVEHNFGIGTFEDAFKSAALGGAFGGIGDLAAFGLGKSLRSAATKATKNFDELSKPLETLENAKKSLTSHQQDYDTAVRRRDRFQNGLPRNPSAEDRRTLLDLNDKVDQADLELQAAKDAVTDAESELAKAQSLTTADVNKAKTEVDRLKKIKEAKGKSKDSYDQWARPPIVAAFAAGAVSLIDLGSDQEGGRGNNNPGERTAEPVPLVWSGFEAANAEGLWGKAPFARDYGVTVDASSPDGYLLHPKELNKAIATRYGGPSGSLASVLAQNHKAFGNIENKQDLPIKPIPKMLPGALSGSQMGANYTTMKNSLDALADQYYKDQLTLKTVITKVEDISRTGQENNTFLINGINRLMQEVRGASDADFVDVMSKAFNEAIKNLEDAIAQHQLAAKAIKDPSQTPSADPDPRNLRNSVDQADSRQYDPGLWATMPPPGQTGLVDPSQLDGYTPGGNTPPGVTGNSPLDNAIRNAELASNPPGNLPNAGSIPAMANAAMDPMSGMLGNLLTTMMPAMWQQRAMQDAMDSDLAARRGELDPSRYEREMAPPTPPVTPPPANTTPWSNQNAQAQPAAPASHTPSGPPSGATAPSSTVPPRNPDADGGVVYTFPDGRTQRVHVMVAKALDKAFANTKGTNAQEAYADTPAVWTDPKDIGTSIGPFELMTGDVAAWDGKPTTSEETDESRPDEQPSFIVGAPTDSGKKPKSDSEDSGRTAILVVFGPAESGTLEAVVNGEVRPFTTEMSDSEGEFGSFVGFRHPKGIDIGAPSDEHVAAQAPDQSAAQTDVPVAAMPA